MRLIRIALSAALVVLVLARRPCSRSRSPGPSRERSRTPAARPFPAPPSPSRISRPASQESVDDRPRGPVHVAAAAARRIPGRGRPPGLPARRTHRRSHANQRHHRHRLQPRGRRADRSDRGPRRRRAARDDHRHGRQAGRQPPHSRAAAEYTQRVLADLPDAGRGRLDRQQLQLDELHGQRGAADHDGHGHRRGDRVLPDRQRVHRHLGVPVGRRDSGVQGARRELPRRVRPQPRQRAERRLQVGHQPVPRQRLRVPARLRLRLEQLLREAGGAAARRFPAQPVRRRRRRADPARQDLLHGLVRRPARTAAVADHDAPCRRGAASGRLLADLRAERPADSHLRPVLDPRESGGRVHPRSVRRQRHSGEPDGSGGAQRPEVLSAAEPAGQRGDRRAELLRDRHRRAERRQPRRPRRSPDLGAPEGVHALFLSQDLQRARGLPPCRHRGRGGAGQRTEPGAQRRLRLQPHRLQHDGDECPVRVRAHPVHLRQPGPGLQAVEPRAAGVDRCQCRPRDVPAIRRRRHADARRERPSLQRVHELHRRRRPDQGARRALAQDRLRGPDAARERLGSAKRRDLQLPDERDPGPGADDRQQHRRFRVRVVPARLWPAQRRPDPELEERRGEQLLLGRLRPGRLAGQLAADAQPRRPLRHRRAADRTLQPDELLRSGRAFAARRSGAGVSGSQRRRGLRRRRWTEPLPVPTGTRTTSRRVWAGRFSWTRRP